MSLCGHYKSLRGHYESLLGHYKESTRSLQESTRSLQEIKISSTITIPNPVTCLENTKIYIFGPNHLFRFILP